jgi:hypothetical protein
VQGAIHSKSLLAFDWRSIGVGLAGDGYATGMKPNPVIHCTLIIRSQIEYSRVTQEVTMRCILEMPATGQRLGFTEIEALLTTLRAQLLEMQYQIIPLEQGKGNS